MINPVMKCPVNHSIVVISPPRLLGFLFQITIELISMAFQLNTNTKDHKSQLACCESSTGDVDDEGSSQYTHISAEYTNLSDSDPGPASGKSSLDSAKPKTKDHYVAEPALQLDSTTMREYALQVALGMRHLEQRGITHR